MPPRLNEQEFIRRAIKLYGDWFNYSRIKYIDYNSIEIEIICNKHKEVFFARPSAHLLHTKTGGCPKCFSEIRMVPFDIFLERANFIFGDRYLYQEKDYHGTATDMKIYCIEHEKYFYKKPKYFLRDKIGCHLCRTKSIREKLGMNSFDFINKAQKIHGFRYDYSNVNYISVDFKIEIICREHGPFPQSPRTHLQGSGCPQCNYTVSKPETEWLNSFGVPNDKHHRNITVKINNKIFRLDGFIPETKTIYEFNGDYWHGNPKIYSPDKMNNRTHTTFGELYRKTLEKETILKSAGYNVISIWESDFKIQSTNKIE